MRAQGDWVVHRFAILGVVLGLACLPFIHFLLVDDWFHVAILDGTVSRVQGATASGPWDLFRFFGGNPQVIQLAKESSITPWFTHPELKIAFWRPLSSLLIAL